MTSQWVKNGVLHISKPDHTTTKAEEQKILEELRDFFMDTGSYMEDLFTNSMVSWACTVIKDDGVPDLYKHLTLEQQDAQKLGREWDTAREALQLELKEARQDRDANYRLAEANSQQLARENTRFQGIIDRFVEERAQWSENYDEACEQRNAAQETVTAQAAEIVRLKALLWDMTEKLNGKV
jgi:hypothetical protein